MRRALWLSEAVRAVILIAALLFICTVFPLRLWQRTITETGGGVRMETSGQIDDEADLIQDFTAQYDRLGAVDIWVDGLLAGRYVEVRVYDGRMEMLCDRYVDLGSESLPGRVRIPVGLDLEVGESYRLFFLGMHGACTMGLQNIPAGASPYFGTLYVADQPSETWRLDMALQYRQPLDKRTSLLLLALIAVVAIFAERMVALVARRRGKERDRIVTVGGTLRTVLAPVFGVCVAVLAALVLMQKFDRRLTDNIFYLLGLLLVGAIGALFFLSSPAVARKYKIPSVIEILQAIAFALAIQAACEYMNGLYDAMHAVASRKEVLWLSVFLILSLIGKRGGEKRKMRLNLFGAAAVLFFVLLIVFRNTRLWGVTLAALFAAGLICYRFSPRRDRWLPVLTAGLILHFAANVVWCLLHRYFVAFVSARFAFIFHTVTVTAEYLTMMDAVAFALLFTAVCRIPREASLREKLLFVRGEALLFGVVSAYVLFTASRTAIFAVSVSVLLLILVIGVRFFARGVAVALLSVLLCFPAVFTLQRLLPPMAGQPVFMEIEDASPQARGAVNWDSTYLISVERFAAVFLEKVTGIEGRVPYNYPEDRYNYDENGEYLYPKIRGGGHPASGGTAEEETAAGDGDVIDRMANGRLTIWRSYLAALNLTGHDTMGVEMPDGEIMVHAHNVYLQLAYDHGMITGIVFLLLMALAAVAGAIYGGMRSARGKAAEIAPDGTVFVPFALTVGFAVAGLTEWNFHLGNMMTIAMLFSWVPLCFKVGK